MILADKIVEERKRLNLSQEELAEKLSVSRQAVSKWESSQSTPDLQKIIAMSALFSVSTDYLLKEDSAREVSECAESDTCGALRCVSMEEANAFLESVREQSRTAALGVLMCILSPVLLVFLAGLSESGIGGVTERFASAAGLAALFILIAAAVFLFVQNGAKSDRFEFIEKEAFETAYGVTGLVKEKKAAYEPVYTRFLSLGIILCILSPLPLVISALLKESDTLAVMMAALLLCIVAAGIYMIVRVSTVMSGYKQLLQEGEYRKDRRLNKGLAAANSIFWGLALTVYFAWSFISMDWERTWIVWPIAGVLCAPVLLIVKACQKDGKR